MSVPGVFRVAVEPGEEVVGRWSRPQGPHTGLSVIYLHGFGSDQNGEKAEFFRTGSLERGFDFYSFDFRGHGRSGGAMVDLTLTRCLSDLEAVVGYLWSNGAERLAVVGSSMGGLVGLWYAALHADHMVGGAHIAPAIGMAESLEELLGEEAMAEWRRTGVTSVTNELGTFDLGWGLVEDLAGYPTERLIELHSRPTLAFQGKLDDRVAWREVLKFAQATAPATTLRLFEDGDHRLLEHREEVWAEMAGFLSGLGRPGSA